MVLPVASVTCEVSPGSPERAGRERLTESRAKGLHVVGHEGSRIHVVQVVINAHLGSVRGVLGLDSIIDSAIAVAQAVEDERHVRHHQVVLYLVVSSPL